MTAALPALPGYRSTTRTSTCRAPRHCKEHRPFTAIPGFESPWGRHRIKDIKRSAARVRQKILLPPRDGRSPSAQPLLAAARKALLCRACSVPPISLNKAIALLEVANELLEYSKRTRPI